MDAQTTTPDPAGDDEFFSNDRTDGHEGAIGQPEGGYEDYLFDRDDPLLSRYRGQRYDDYSRDRTEPSFVQDLLAFWEELYADSGFGIWLGNYRDTGMEREANELLSEFIADKIRARVEDPETAEKLIPKDHGFGTKRVPLETNYYEVYNQPNVRLVDLKEDPIERITPTAIETAQGKAKATQLQGEAEAAAIKAKADALRENKDLVNLTVAEKWNGQLPTVTTSGGGSILNIDSGVLGAAVNKTEAPAPKTP